jgi:hypothetical protein
MDSDALIELIHRRNQPNNLQLGILAQYLKRPGTVFPATPAQ